MIVLPGLVLIINPSSPIRLNSSFVTIDDNIAEEEEIPAINELDFSIDADILRGVPVNPEKARDNSALMTAIVEDVPTTTGLLICFLYWLSIAVFEILLYRSQRS